MTIRFDNGSELTLSEDKSVLRWALENNISIVHACDGKARCSTCRIVVIDGVLPPRNKKEQALADTLRLPDEVRLACQLPASHSMEIRRVLKDETDQRLFEQSKRAEERSLAILFADIRSFTPFSERHLPYDIVHILNRFFLAMGEVITANQGRIDKYTGDGMMTIFGLEGDAHPAQLALQAARDMLQVLVPFNDHLDETFGERFEVGIGVHYGPVVVGNIGHPANASVTAIGDTVNVAARIETCTKWTEPKEPPCDCNKYA